ncbi:MAG TPA: CHAT domain-containing protein [Thermoanaerobaculia bacterium]|nr:CHAT domain-containing protein [Thermoanaerobaculia bacterium]
MRIAKALRSEPGKDLVRDLAKPIVTRLAPDEIEDFDELAAAYFADPHLEGDEMLGDGFGLIPDLVLVLSFVTITVDHLLRNSAISARSLLRNLAEALPGERRSGEDSTRVELAAGDLERALAAAAAALRQIHGEARTKVSLQEIQDLVYARLFPGAVFLFLGANPDGSTALGIARELHQVEAVLREAPLRERILLTSDLAISVDDLQRTLLAHRPRLVHFSGHGNRSNAILVESEGGVAREVSAESLSNLLRVFSDRLRCVVLNACLSEGQAKAIAEHTDAVVGMSAGITDRAAISFSRSFYRALGYGTDLQKAFDLGCSQIDLDGFKLEAGIPRLIRGRKNPCEVVLVPQSSSA